MNYKVSVIIPTYNVGNFISGTVESIINQTIGFENIEVIIVDDGSTDSTIDILKGYSQKYDNIKCFFPEGNSGTPGRGRNMGIDNATSDYIMFLDADDRYVENVCEVLLDVISETGKDIVICNHKVVNNHDFSDVSKFNQDFSYKIYSTNDEIVFHDPYMWNKIFKKDFLNKYNIRCFDKYYGEDSYFCVKSYLNTDEVPILNNFIGYIYNVRDSEDDSSFSNSYDINGFCRFLKGFYKIVTLIKDAGRQDLVDCLMKKEFLVIFSKFVLFDSGSNSKRDVLEELYKFQKYCDIDSQLGEKWASIFFKLLEKRKFNILLLYSNILNSIYTSKRIRTFYRNFHMAN